MLGMLGMLGMSSLAAVMGVGVRKVGGGERLVDKGRVGVGGWDGGAHEEFVGKRWGGLGRSVGGCENRVGRWEREPGSELGVDRLFFRDHVPQHRDGLHLQLQLRRHG